MIYDNVTLPQYVYIILVLYCLNQTIENIKNHLVKCYFSPEPGRCSETLHVILCHAVVSALTG